MWTKQTTNEVEQLCGENYGLAEEARRTSLAISKGFEIVRNTSSRLTFDLDGEEALATFKQRVAILERKGFSPFIQITKSMSGNYHAVVDVNEAIQLTESLCVAIQACLGSDWKREFLGVLRLLNKQESVSMLFRPPTLEIVEEIKVTTPGDLL